MMNDVQMDDVRSSNIRKVGYDFNKNELHVQFRNGSVYVYSEVPPQTHRDLIAADSVGGYLNNHIKDKFTYVKIILS